MHSGEKSNKCNQCDYASIQAGDLKKHLKIHSGEKPNKCNQCDYASSYASHLRTHLKTHSGEKTNKCSQCDYASSQLCNLRRHMARHIWTHCGEKSTTIPTLCWKILWVKNGLEGNRWPKRYTRSSKSMALFRTVTLSQPLRPKNVILLVLLIN